MIDSSKPKNFRLSDFCRCNLFVLSKRGNVQDGGLMTNFAGFFLPQIAPFWGLHLLPNFAPNNFPNLHLFYSISQLISWTFLSNLEPEFCPMHDDIIRPWSILLNVDFLFTMTSLPWRSSLTISANLNNKYIPPLKVLLVLTQSFFGCFCTRCANGWNGEEWDFVW